jgi:hypothetical protein
MTTMTICSGDVMAAHQHQEPFARAPGPWPEQRSLVLEDEWQERLRYLEQWICELLIKNQQLRMSLESVKALEQRSI